MPGFLSRMFRKKQHVDTKKIQNGVDSSNGTVVQIDPWEKSVIRREDVVELLKAAGDELKARGLDTPLFLLPFRPSSDLSSTKTFIRRYFAGGRPSLHGGELAQELRLTDVLVLAGVLRWIWTRLEGGIVGWEAYELFAKAEQDCNYSRDAFNVLIPLSVESELHTAVILDFFGFLASVAAHAKSNGFSGQKLARIAGWYAFNVKGSSQGFADGYSNWEKAANATEHLFLAYLRSIAPTPGQISAALPLSLSTLLSQTAYPPKPITHSPIAPGATSILRITLSVRNVSPTPFALLDRLARHSFIQTNPNEKGDALESILEAQNNHNDPTKALTNECLRVLRLISATNESDVLTAALLRTPNSLGDKTWTRFADLGFEGLDPSDNESDEDELSHAQSPTDFPRKRRDFLGVNRPKTPSWGDFLVSGFTPEGAQAGFSLPPDKLLPPINTTTLPPVSSSSRRSVASRDGTTGFKSNLHELEKGEVKSVDRVRVDDALWSVWMESLCGEELEEKKAVFGRCVVAETNAHDPGRRWIVIEEIVKGAEITPELTPPTKSKKISKKAQRKAAEEETARKRRSTSDLISRPHDEYGSTTGREMRAQALAKQSATLRTISETQREVSIPKPRRKSMEYNGRPSVMLGAEVSRAMKWADSFEKIGNGRREYNEGKALPERPPPQQQSQPKVQEKEEVHVVPVKVVPSTDLRNEGIHEIPREPKEPPKVAVPTPRSPESKPVATLSPATGPVLLPTDTSIHNSSIHKSPEKPKSPPTSNKFKKFFNVKSKEEKAAKRTSRVVSPIPPSPTPAPTQPQLKTNTLQPISRTPEPRAPSPSIQPSVNETKEWDDEFDGTHRLEPNIATQPTYTAEEDYRPATPPSVPTFRASTPTRERTSDEEELDRWAQIRKAAGQRALHRNVAPVKDDEIAEVNIPRIRNAERGANPMRGAKVGVEEEDEESVDARVARIRKRVQELTAGMGDDD